MAAASRSSNKQQQQQAAAATSSSSSSNKQQQQQQQAAAKHSRTMELIPKYGFAQHASQKTESPPKQRFFTQLFRFESIPEAKGPKM